MNSRAIEVVCNDSNPRLRSRKSGTRFFVRTSLRLFRFCRSVRWIGKQQIHRTLRQKRKSRKDVLTKNLVPDFRDCSLGFESLQTTSIALEFICGECQRPVCGRASHCDRNLHYFCYNPIPNFKLFSFLAVTMHPRVVLSANRSVGIVEPQASCQKTRSSLVRRTYAPDGSPADSSGTPSPSAIPSAGELAGADAEKAAMVEQAKSRVAAVKESLAAEPARRRSAETSG